jgi:hypothetical protein
VKAIFLDIDGVMVTHKHLSRTAHPPLMDFDPDSVKNLKQILEATGAKLVISSTWCRGGSIASAKDLFLPYGLNNYIVGVTPALRDVVRGDEIQAYLDTVRGTKRQVDEFVILDDDADMGDLMEHLIQTDYFKGIDSEVAAKVIDALGASPCTPSQD